MRLADFILRESTTIVDRWETFARTCLPAAGQMDTLALRDHAEQILHAIALDLRSAQTREEQHAKSIGQAPLNAAETAAQIHAVLRARSGFDIRQLVSEYRALRASVLRQAFDAWAPAQVPMDDVIRFNEAIDQALAESVAFYSAQVERARNLLLGMLGHDMRSPLQAIRMTALYLHDLNAGKEVGAAAARLIRSGARMQSLLDGLVDFNRTQLGLGMHVERRPCDLRDHLSGQLDELRAIYPERVFQLGIDGDCRGSWDGARVEQLVANLVINAIKYGAPGAPVRIGVTGHDHEVAIDVANTGVPAEPDQLAALFEPLRRGGGSGSGADEGSLGLGLFIAREVARAHGGSIDARCDGTQTVFSVRLPKENAQAA